MKFNLYTLGCKVNQYESQEIRELLEKEGHTYTDLVSKADIIIINSCTVTAESVRKTRQQVRKFRKINEYAIIVLTGCAIQAEPHIINDLPEVNIILGNKSNINIIEALNKYLNTNKFVSGFCEHQPGDKFFGSGITRFDGHTRAFLKIQDGCDRFCSYCLIPYARGRSRSKSLEEIDKELKNLAQNGYKEIVFVGINLSDYGKNTPYSLPDALKLAEKYDVIERIRLGSLEPDHITDKMIEKLGEIKKLCPQFHISVQSGCNNVLKKMNRHYTAVEYEALVKKLRETFKNASITTDILVGFPTETKEDFETTIDFVKRVKFEKIHVFPYSVREGTVAAKLPQHTNDLKNTRAQMLIAVAKETRCECLNEYIGKTVNVLFETSRLNYFDGYTENYTPVRVYTTDNLKGKILKVKINLVNKFDECCVGEVV